MGKRNWYHPNGGKNRPHLGLMPIRRETTLLGEMLREGLRPGGVKRKRYGKVWTQRRQKTLLENRGHLRSRFPLEAWQ